MNKNFSLFLTVNFYLKGQHSMRCKKMEFIDNIINERIKHRPETTFNIFGIVEYEKIREKYYFMKHFETREEAQKPIDQNDKQVMI